MLKTTKRAKINKKNRSFGCEFEFYTQWEDMHIILAPIIEKIYGRNRLHARNKWFKSNKNYKEWHLKLDSSTLCEVCTPISKWDDIQKIEKVIQELSLNKDVKVTKNDALHIHVDARDIDPQKILALWVKYEKIIFSLFPKHRRNNSYCEQAIPTKEKNTIHKIVANYFKKAEKNSLDHYFSLSFYFYKNNQEGKNRKTVEFRLAEGTKDPVFVRNWVLFCLSFVEAAKKVNMVNLLCEPIQNKSLEEMMQELELKDKKLIQWLYNRKEKYSRN